MKRIILIALVAALAGACAAPTPRPTISDLLAGVPDYADGVRYAVGSEAEWQRAQVWLANHSRWRIQIATDALIETYSPGEYSSGYGFTLTREPVASGGYVIRMSAVCSNRRDNCEPERQGLKRAFYHYVATGQDVLASAGHFYGIH